MIYLRELNEKDAPLMLEWMHDPDIQKGLKKKMLDATIEDANTFIKRASLPNILETGMNLHYAIANQNDEYLGTVSLKAVDLQNRTAEYAIITRKNAQRKGIGYAATGLVLKKAFEEIGLNRVYLSVYSNNAAAIKLYEKCGFKYEGEFRNHFFIEEEYIGWKWYGILKEEYNEALFEQSI